MKKNTTSLSDALFPKARQAVLGLLFGQPDKSFYTNEIIRLSNSGTGVVQRELEKLSAVGLINIHLIANKKLYQANKESPLFEELQGITLKTFGLADVLKDALGSVASKIKIAFVYGSIATRNDYAKSDIDLMVISDTLSYTDLFSLLAPSQEKLGREINPTFYSEDNWATKIKSNNHFVLQIIKQPKIFLIGSADELSELG